MSETAPPLDNAATVCPLCGWWYFRDGRGQTILTHHCAQGRQPASPVATALALLRARRQVLDEAITAVERVLPYLTVALLLTACSATATYTTPTGQQATCTKAANYPGSGLLGLLTSPLYAMAEYDAATQYSQCKSQLEAQGWARTP